MFAGTGAKNSGTPSLSISNIIVWRPSTGGHSTLSSFDSTRPCAPSTLEKMTACRTDGPGATGGSTRTAQAKRPVGAQSSRGPGRDAVLELHARRHRASRP